MTDHHPDRRSACCCAVAAGASVYRIVRGPSILDRMIASDMLLTTLILVLGAEMVYHGHTRNIPIMIVLAAVAVFASMAVARYVSKQGGGSRPCRSSAPPGNGRDAMTGDRDPRPDRCDLPAARRSCCRWRPGSA